MDAKELFEELKKFYEDAGLEVLDTKPSNCKLRGWENEHTCWVVVPNTISDTIVKYAFHDNSYNHKVRYSYMFEKEGKIGSYTGEYNYENLTMLIRKSLHAIGKTDSEIDEIFSHKLKQTTLLDFL